MSIEARAHAAGMGLWATKAGMTQIFTPEGLCLPATVLALEEGNIVTQVLLVTLTFLRQTSSRNMHISEKIRCSVDCFMYGRSGDVTV